MSEDSGVFASPTDPHADRGALRSCPFCAGPGAPIKQRWSGRDFWGVSCDGECLTFFDCRAATEAEAVAAWNERPDSGAGHAPEGHHCGGIIHASADQFERLMAHFEADKRADAADMPTEHDALKVMARVMARLKELGWNDAIYCPKDGSAFDIIEAGSTGIHDCHYEGEWPKGSWWVREAGDLWPSRPILYRPKAALNASPSVGGSGLNPEPNQPTERKEP